ncbi:MAG TPA: glycosyltransferase family 2 protein [Anaerolineaceae bacterium]|nr:glycosyltransferase family 2 protein [Anaerolineaceae bacterium]
MAISPEDQKRVIALIPAYNEAERIGDVIKQTMQYLPVLVVDDGSKDETAGVARLIGAEVISLTPNRGKGAALMTGFKYAVENQYDSVLTLDADGQHDPAEIPLFLAAFEHGADLVIGQRDFKKMPFPRNYSNTIGTWLFSRALGEYCPDNQSGYRLHSRRMVEASLASTESNFEFEVEIIVRCVSQGYQLEWVPIKTIYAGQGSHIKPLRHIRHFMRIVRQTRAYMKQNGKSKT